MSRKVKFNSPKRHPELIAGLDCAFSKDSQRIIAAAVVLKMPDFNIIEIKSAIRKAAFPYIPGLLSFREAPACIGAAGKLRNKPDVFIIDGQGIAHPRRLGLAAHLGIIFNQPTIGCAKSRLIGNFKYPGIKKGAYTFLKDKGQTIGAVLRTRTNVKPVFISVGNKLSLEDAIQTILDSTTKYRLPEPTRLAHQTVSKMKLSCVFCPPKF
jgi:deoxyribonuclease V